MVGDIVDVSLTIPTAVKVVTVSEGVPRPIEGVGLVHVDLTAVAVIGVENVRDSVVVIVPVLVVLKTVTVDVGIQ